MDVMIKVSLFFNIVVLVPVCVGLITNASWARDSYGAQTPARRILLSVYLAIAAVSLLLLSDHEPKFVAALLLVQIAYKLTTALTVGKPANFVVAGNLGIAAVHMTTLVLIWQGDPATSASGKAVQGKDISKVAGKVVVKSLYSPTNDDWEAIVEPDSVTILDLMNFPGDAELVTDETLQRLRVFKGLKTLVIGCPHVSDRGLKTIAELKGLEALIIYEGQITDGGIQILKTLPKMRTVGIFGTHVTAKGIDSLKADLKNASIELWGMGEHGEIFDANGCLTSKFLKQHRGLISKRR